MDDKPAYKFSPKRFLLWLPVYLVLAFALYVLSAGPMYWAIYRAWFLENGSLLALLYSPLVILSSTSDTFAGWLEWYIGLWVY